MTEVNDLYLAAFWWTVGFLAVMWLVLAGALVVLRLRSARAGDHGPGERPRSLMDVAWTVAPAVIVISVAVPAVVSAVAQDTATESAVVETTGPETTGTEQAVEPTEFEGDEIAPERTRSTSYDDGRG